MTHPMIDQETIVALNVALMKNLHVMKALYDEFGYGHPMPPDEQIAKFQGNVTEAAAYEMAVAFADQINRNLDMLKTLRRGNIKQQILNIAEVIDEKEI
uniref:Uncharacterized protein n=1 Tax=Pseudomonas phage HRDY3 TaxID=3236930 RepID=A0AB39CDY1_9VIRU